LFFHGEKMETRSVFFPCFAHGAGFPALAAALDLAALALAALALALAPLFLTIYLSFIF
jgi:hypothetical protein